MKMNAIVLRKPLVLATLILASSVRAADPDAVKKPYIELGDCWTYQVKGAVFRDGAVNEYEMCVTFIDRTRDILLAVGKMKGPEREIDLSFTTEWGVGTWISGWVSSPPAKVFNFPLKVGDKHQVDTDYYIPSYGASGKGEQRLSIEVVGWEDVTVPAGTFRALRIEGKTYATPVMSSAAKQTGVGLKIWWYVPKVNRYVKFEETLRAPSVVMNFADLNVTEELVSFRLNQ